MWQLCAFIGLVWLALSPPLFTNGACTAEFDQETARLEQDLPLLATPEAAVAYWRGRNVPVTALTAEQCRRARPGMFDRCGNGSVVHSRVAVTNRICRLYRDDEVRVQLHYSDSDYLVRTVTDMDPFKSLHLPFIDTTVHWGR